MQKMLKLICIRLYDSDRAVYYGEERSALHMAIRTYNDWYLAHKEALAEKIRGEDHTEGEKLTAEIVRYSHLKNHLLAEDHEQPALRR